MTRCITRRGEHVEAAFSTRQETEIALRMMWRIRHEDEARECAGVERWQLGKIVVGPDVAVDHKERCCTEQGQGAE